MSVFWSVPAGEACVSVTVPVAGEHVRPAFVTACAVSRVSDAARVPLASGRPPLIVPASVTVAAVDDIVTVAGSKSRARRMACRC